MVSPQEFGSQCIILGTRQETEIIEHVVLKIRRIECHQLLFMKALFCVKI